MTLELTLGATAIGAVVGVVILILRRVPFGPVQWLAVGWVEIVRGVPPLVWLLLVFLGVGGFAPMAAAILVLGLIAGAYLSEIYRSGLESVARGQYEAIASLAVPAPWGYLRVIVPQAARVSGPAIVSYVIGLIKDTSLASVIGVAELTFVANRAANRTGDGIAPFLTVGVIYLLISVCFGMLGRVLEHRSGRRAAR